MNPEGTVNPDDSDRRPSGFREDYVVAEIPGGTERREEESLGKKMLQSVEIADARLDIEGALRFGDSWNRVAEWAKDGWDWAKRPPETYAEAIGKAALFSVGTTVFLAPVFLFHNCKQVHDARQKEERESRLANA